MVTDNDKLAAELLSGKVVIYCEDHGYVPGAVTSMPMEVGCPGCCKAELIYHFATTPPDKREERLAQLESLFHHMVESLEHGILPFTMFDHPQLEIEKDALPDPEKKIILTD